MAKAFYRKEEALERGFCPSCGWEKDNEDRSQSNCFDCCVLPPTTRTRSATPTSPKRQSRRSTPKSVAYRKVQSLCQMAESRNNPRRTPRW
ncbi:MAG: hypothetical protein AMXMBFR44_3080 [Candidatus Campbellbacteria bacterium]